VVGRVLLRETDHQIDDPDLVHGMAHQRTIEARLTTVATVAHGSAKGSTPATVLLQKAGVTFSVHDFGHDPTDRHYGAAAAAALGVHANQVFKTLLATVDGAATVPGVASAKVAVGIVPVSGQLSLKELAAATGAKRAEMCDPAAAERLTGYVVGGISPFGQRKLLPTVIDESCLAFATIFVSGGRRGFDIEIAPADLISVLQAKTARIASAR
jgi:Cys-tRNA(Pro)/Cys-tRNA(Cys) deacylase